MFEGLATAVRKTLAQVFTFPTRMRSELSDYNPTLTGQVITPELAMTCSPVAACVRLLSETVAALPLHVYRDLGKSKVIETNHPNYDLLHSSPNEFQTTNGFIQQAVTQVLLYGNFFAVIERNGKGEPVALWPLRSQGVTVVIEDGAVRYRYFAGAKKEVYDHTDILHFRGPSMDGILGVSIIHLAREVIAVALAAQTYSARFFQNDARPGGLITGAQFRSKDEESTFLKAWQSGQSGANRHKTAILPVGLAYEEIGISPDDAQLLDARQFAAIEIARAFRVPPTMIGDMTRVSYASSESEIQLFAMHSLVPLCASFEAEIDLKLFPARTQFFAKFDVNSIIRGDQASRYAAYAQGLGGQPFLTVADVRLAENLPYIAGTENLSSPVNMAPHGQKEKNNGTLDTTA